MFRNGIYSHIVNMHNTNNIVIWIIKHTWYIISYEKRKPS